MSGEKVNVQKNRGLPTPKKVIPMPATKPAKQTAQPKKK